MTGRQPPVVSSPPIGSQNIAASPSTSNALGSQARVRARSLFNQAIESQQTGQQAHALTLLQEAIELDPELKEAYNSLGNLYYQQQRYHQAITMYQKALAIDPDYAKAHNNLGSTYLQLAMKAQALEELQKALQADRSYGLAYYNLACVYAREGDSATAARYLQQAIALEPQARSWAQTDDDFARVRATPEMRQLLGSS
jgi:tetratricopeptide (TPR) repeat protein